MLVGGALVALSCNLKAARSRRVVEFEDLWHGAYISRFSKV